MSPSATGAGVEPIGGHNNLSTGIYSWKVTLIGSSDDTIGKQHQVYLIRASAAYSIIAR